MSRTRLKIPIPTLFLPQNHPESSFGAIGTARIKPVIEP